MSDRVSKTKPAHPGLVRTKASTSLPKSGRSGAERQDNTVPEELKGDVRTKSNQRPSTHAPKTPADRLKPGPGLPPTVSLKEVIEALNAIEVPKNSAAASFQAQVRMALNNHPDGRQLLAKVIENYHRSDRMTWLESII